MADQSSKPSGQSPENLGHLLDPQPIENTPPREEDEQFDSEDSWDEPDPAAAIWEPLDLEEDDGEPEPDDGDFWIERDDANG